jgi:hypothetical protein
MAREPPDSACLLLGVQGSEIDQLHCETRRRSTQQARDLDDLWVSSMHLTEGQRKVQPARNSEFIV